MSALIVGCERLVVVVGPSGAGKDSVIGAWLAALSEAERPHRARRTITRPADIHEVHEPLTPPGFREAVRSGAFAFEWEAHGLRYGVRREELMPLATGRWVVMNGSRSHLPRLRERAPQARVIEIDAPAPVRAGRLAQRGREASVEQDLRLARSVSAEGCDLRIVNDRRLEEAVAELDAWWRASAVCAASTPGAPPRTLPSPCHTPHQNWCT